MQRAAPQQDSAMQTVTVSRGSIEQIVTAQGKLEPKEYVDVGAQVSGQLKNLYVEIGDNVRQGALLAEIDPRVYESQVEATKASLKTLQAQLAEQQAQIAFSESQFNRNKKLIEAKAISQEALEDAETSYKVAKAKAASLRAQIEQVNSTLSGDETNLSYTKIFAPMTGTVVLQPTRLGQTVNASQTAPTIVQIANLDMMTVRAQVAEADVSLLKPDMKVFFTTLGNERRWKGTVRQILPSPEVINDVVLYNALVDVDNADHQLMSGMSAQMFFEQGRAENVLLIPVAALGKRLPDQDNQSGKAYAVKVPQGKEQITKTVYIGLMNRDNAELRGGLNEGDVVIVPVAQSSPSRGQGQGGFRGGPRL